MTKDNNINTPKKRTKLAVRREAYWHSFAKGRSLGYRKTANDGTWIIKQGRKQSRLGDVTDFTFQEALDKAMIITKATETGDPKNALTLHDVLKKYQKKKAAEHGEAESLATLNYFENALPPKMLNARVIDLTLEDFDNWKHDIIYSGSDDLERTRASKATCNRRLSILKASLSYVFGSSYIGGRSELKKFKNVDKPRDLFLTVEQVKIWMEYTSGAFHDFSKASMLTGMRPGELRLLTVTALKH